MSEEGPRRPTLHKPTVIRPEASGSPSTVSATKVGVKPSHHEIEFTITGRLVVSEEVEFMTLVSDLMRTKEHLLQRAIEVEARVDIPEGMKELVL